MTVFATISVAAPQEVNEFSPITIYGTGFGESFSEALPQTEIITSSQIYKSGLNTVGDILDKLGHLYMQQDLGVNMNASPDIRGYGATSANNTVILIDGIKISQNEQAAARIWSIPVEIIDHIEIIRGSSTVLYGEGATSGVINVITNKQKDDFGAVSIGVGSYGAKNTNVYISKNTEAGKLSVFGKTASLNGYREQSESKLKAAGFQYDRLVSSDTIIGFRYSEDKDKANLPGFLTLAKYNQNPTLPQYALADLYNNQASNTMVTNRIGSLYVKINDGDFNYLVDFSRRDTRTDYMDTRDPNWSSSADYSYHSQQDAINAKLKINNFGNSNNTATVGFSHVNSYRDLSKWGLPTTSGQYATGYNSISSNGVFAQDDWKITNSDRLTIGIRKENFKQNATASDIQYVPTYSEQSGKNNLAAYEIQYTKELSNSVSNYVKFGRSFRLPNVDDLNRYCGSTCVQNLVLSPQINKDFELGMVYHTHSNRGHLKYYRSDISNEILFDKYTNFELGYNINVPHTKKQGIEFFNSFKYSTSLSLNSSIDIVDAKFLTDSIESATGIYGKSIPGTPNHIVGLGLDYTINSNNSVSWKSRLIGRQYPQGDSKNVSELASYTVSDLSYRWADKKWSIVANVNNLFDKKYGTAILASSTSPNYPYGMYPNWGRNYLLTARYSFQ